MIFLDEPTRNLRNVKKRLIWDLIKKHRFGKTIVLATSDLEEAEYLADRLCVMSQGKLITDCSVEEFRQQNNVGYKIILQRKDLDQLDTNS